MKAVNHFSIYRYINFLRKGVASTDDDKGNVFNEHFHSVYTQRSFTLPFSHDMLAPDLHLFR